MNRPFVSVVTPFHNTAPYLAQCIESVLAQTYSEFEYILVDNCSTDRSEEIAREYARRDPRVRLTRRPELLTQVQNYNRALTEISPGSDYCKIVQADDFIFPDCLRLMVQAFEQSASIGLVSSYWLKGNEVRGSGFPYPTSVLRGSEMAGLYLRTGIWVFGSPTAVMYRSGIVRKKGEAFYDEGLLHEDSDKCMEILKEWDFGFAHQILSFSRADNESISSAIRDLQPAALDRYIMVQRHASAFLESDEATVLKKQTRRNYYRMLAKEALRGRSLDFWQYQRRGLTTLGETLHRPYLAWRIALELLWAVVNPGASLSRITHLSGRTAETRLVRESSSGGIPSGAPLHAGPSHLGRD